jgi:hypothetical protein
MLQWKAPAADCEPAVQQPHSCLVRTPFVDCFRCSVLDRRHSGAPSVAGCALLQCVMQQAVLQLESVSVNATSLPAVRCTLVRGHLCLQAPPHEVCMLRLSGGGGCPLNPWCEHVRYLQGKLWGRSATSGFHFSLLHLGFCGALYCCWYIFAAGSHCQSCITGAGPPERPPQCLLSA